MALIAIVLVIYAGLSGGLAGAGLAGGLAIGCIALGMLDKQES